MPVYEGSPDNVVGIVNIFHTEHCAGWQFRPVTSSASSGRNSLGSTGLTR
jgi:hypothetical protein